jgi:L-alanine-DL-glutamate epimerase-like enolase superfamily enzyme
LHVPTGPGLGIEFDEGRLADHLVPIVEGPTAA